MPPPDPDDESLSAEELFEINRPVRVERSRGRSASDLACADYLILYPMLTLFDWEALMHELIPTREHGDAVGSPETGIGRRMRADEARGVITFPCGFVEFEWWAHDCHVTLPSVLVAGICEAKEYAQATIASASPPIPPIDASTSTPTTAPASTPAPTPTRKRTKLNPKGLDEDLNQRAFAMANAMRKESGLVPTKGAVAKRLSKEVELPEPTVMRRISKTW